MTNGVAVGKFWPFHKGHEYLLREGAKQCDTLHVLVCQSVRYDMDILMRVAWIKRILLDLDNIRVYIFDQDASGLADFDSPGWARETVRLLGMGVDLVVSSENYGEFYAEALGAKNLVVDKAREIVPVSGTQIRMDPRVYAHYLDSRVLHSLLKDTMRLPEPGIVRPRPPSGGAAREGPG